MDIKEQAKKIIAKGKLLNDSELIDMGLQMLEGYTESNEQITEEPIVIKRDITSQFVVNKPNAISKRNTKKVSIQNSPRVNSFIDDGLDYKGPEYVTPEIVPTQRRKPVEKVNQTCAICGKEEKVLPDFVREYYRCNSCFLKGK